MRIIKPLYLMKTCQSLLTSAGHLKVLVLVFYFSLR